MKSIKYLVTNQRIMIYHTSNKEISGINLWRVDNSTFRILKYDNLTTVMTGSDYTIIHYKIVSVFVELTSKEIDIKPIKIIRLATNEDWNEFHEITIKNHVDPETIKTLNKDQNSIWQYKNHLFVSESLKNRLESKISDDLEFSVGFGNFG